MLNWIKQFDRNGKTCQGKYPASNSKLNKPCGNPWMLGILKLSIAQIWCCGMRIRRIFYRLNRRPG